MTIVPINAARSGSMSRLVCQFSCGAASAVATKLILAEVGHRDVVIVNAFLQEEHEDNRRFLADCEAWFDHPITVLRDDKYSASTMEVWRRRRYLKNRRGGAPCSTHLKKEVLERFKLPTDVAVLGFTVEEQERFDHWLDSNSPHARAPLIERALGKADCLAIVVRRVFPDRFLAIADLQASIGRGAALFRNRTTGERFMLHELDPAAGRHDEVLPDCSFFCEAAEHALE